MGGTLRSEHAYCINHYCVTARVPRYVSSSTVAINSSLDHSMYVYSLNLVGRFNRLL